MLLIKAVNRRLSNALNKVVYQRLSNAFDESGLSETVQCFLIKLFIGDCPMTLNKPIYRRLSNAFD